MNQKVRKISYKMYLTAQGLILVIGAGVLIWNIIAGIHDLHVATKSKECVETTLGKEASAWQNEKLVPERWNDSLVTYATGLDHPSKKYALMEFLH